MLTQSQSVQRLNKFCSPLQQALYIINSCSAFYTRITLSGLKLAQLKGSLKGLKGYFRKHSYFFFHSVFFSVPIIFSTGPSNLQSL